MLSDNWLPSKSGNSWVPSCCKVESDSSKRGMRSSLKISVKSIFSEGSEGKSHPKTQSIVEAKLGGRSMFFVPELDSAMAEAAAAQQHGATAADIKALIDDRKTGVARVCYD